jgi:hypothetical protein
LDKGGATDFFKVVDVNLSAIICNAFTVLFDR